MAACAFTVSGPCLQDIQLSVYPVLAPLDIHRSPIVRLDGHGESTQLFDIGIGDAELRPLCVGHRLRVDGFSGLATIRIHHANRLAAE